ncbi:VOC family protein [Nonomuraea sp. NPDC003727]
MTAPHDAGNRRPPAVRQLRLVVEAEDYEAALAFYRDVLGLPEQAAFSSGDGARVAILDAGQATLEIANPAQKKMIDDVEVGRQVAPKIRVAFEVDDARATTDELVAAGAEQVAPPTVTPWQSLNSRLDTPGGLHITLFQELRTLEERESLDGFGTEDGRRADS